MRLSRVTRNTKHGFIWSPCNRKKESGSLTVNSNQLYLKCIIGYFPAEVGVVIAKALSIFGFCITHSAWWWWLLLYVLPVNMLQFYKEAISTSVQSCLVFFFPLCFLCLLSVCRRLCSSVAFCTCCLSSQFWFCCTFPVWVSVSCFSSSLQHLQQRFNMQSQKSDDQSAA